MNVNIKEELNKTVDKNYANSHLTTKQQDMFVIQLKKYINSIKIAINNGESEEHIKSFCNELLRTFYTSVDGYMVNTYKKVDSAIIRDGKALVLIENKRPGSSEMPGQDSLCCKALYELVLYYLDETRDINGVKPEKVAKMGTVIPHLIITDGYNWFIFDGKDFDHVITGLIEEHYNYRRGLTQYSKNDGFFAKAEEYFRNINVTRKLNFICFDMRRGLKSTRELRYIYKALSPEYLLKRPIAIKTKTLDRKFYNELLYIMGFEEIQSSEGNKPIIDINKTLQGTLAYQTYNLLVDINYKGLSNEEAKEETFEMVITWINRLLFIKLFEAQLRDFNHDEASFNILTTKKIKSFEDLDNLFFKVLGTKDRSSDFQCMFSDIPYLNSALFEASNLEISNFHISALKNTSIQLFDHTVIHKGTKVLPIVEYLIVFLQRYKFEANDNSMKQDIIDASVLGLMFEKINGYKDAAVYTPSSITSYICKDAIDQCILNKLNKAFRKNYKNLIDFSMYFDTLDKKITANNIINSIKICDPAVGSGHFLVSALNRIIAIKSSLGVLMMRDSRGNYQAFPCEIHIEDDVLVVLDENNQIYHYDRASAQSRNIQKTLFEEKQQIIGNCLFGVDINPKAVEICQLRLWIELLKNAYYNDNNDMQTLPNIDINIKQGNSLLSKIHMVNANFDSEILDKLNEYRVLISKYKVESNKVVKKKIDNQISEIKKLLTVQVEQIKFKGVFADSTESSKQSNTKASEQEPFEWAIEFPEIVDEKGQFIGFDCVIGNPPYIRVQKLDHNLVDQYKTNWTVAKGKFDISILFIELAFKILNNSGRVCYITSNQFRSADYGKALRGSLSQKRYIEKIVDFGELPVFDGVITYVDILTLTKESHNTIKYAKIQSLPFKEPQNYTLIDTNTLKDTPWLLGCDAETTLRQKILNSTTDTMADVARCWSGVFTGKDKLLMWDLKEPIDFIEKSLIKSVIRAEDFSRYTNAIPSRKIFYPYKEINGQTRIIDLQELQNNYPLAYKFVVENAETLKSRKDSRKTMGDRTSWYGLIRFGDLARFNKRKIVCKGEIKKHRFGIDETKSAFSCGRVFSITVENGNAISLEYLLGVLNSKLMEFFIHGFAPKKQGGYYSYGATILNRLPIKYNNVDQREISLIVSNILTCHDDNNKLDNKLIEKKIDTLVYCIYGITNEEQQIIENYLAKENGL